MLRRRPLVGSVVLAALAVGSLALPLVAGQREGAEAGVRVSGVVVGASMTPAFVTLGRDFRVAQAGFLAPLKRVEVGLDGRFVFDDVQPGAYRIAMRLGSDLPVVVGTADISGLELHDVGVTEVFPSFRMDDGSEVPQSLRFELDMGDGTVLSGSLRPDYPFIVPPGRRFLFLLPPDGVFVRSMVSAGVDLRREPLVIDPEAPERGLQIVLTRLAALAPPATSIQGRVTGGAGAMTVSVKPMMSTRSAAVSVSAPVAPDGSFEIVGLKPGMYTLDVPPAFGVIEGLAVPQAGATVQVTLPEGRLFSGGGVPVRDPQGGFVPYSFGPVDLVARGEAGEFRFPVRAWGFWGALPPGEYRLALDNLPPQVTVASLEADGRDLRRTSYVVPVDRNPPPIRLALTYAGPVPEWIRQAPSVFPSPANP